MTHILNEHFDNIYVLHIRNELKKVKPKIDKEKLKVQYFKGVDGKTDMQEEYKKISNKTLSCGQFGHISSFSNILRDAIEHNYNKILILESDIYFCKNLQENFKKYLDFNYKILYLGASQYMFYHEHTWLKIKLNDNYYNAYKTLGTFAIGLDRSIFEEYLNILQLFKYTSDVALIGLQEKYNKMCYVTYPNLVACNLIKSNTASNRTINTDQLIFMEKYRWKPEFYNLIDYHTFETVNDCWYMLTFELNTKTSNYAIKIVDDINSKTIFSLCELNILNLINNESNEITNKINSKLNIHNRNVVIKNQQTNNQNIINNKQNAIYFKSMSTLTTVVTDSIFVNILQIVFIHKKMVLDLLKNVGIKYKNTYLIKYYLEAVK